MSSDPDSYHGFVEAVALSNRHGFSKDLAPRIRLLKGLGVEGDAHAGACVQHRSRVARDPTQPNLRQVHVLHAELFDELGLAGFPVTAGQLGENLCTRGIDLLALPTDCLLHVGLTAVLRVTGLRNPCTQLDDFLPGLMNALMPRDERGERVRKAGVMAVVEADGDVCPGDPIHVSLPPLPHRPLLRV